MRTTLDIEDDVLQAARGLAHASHQSLGKTLSDLERRGLRSSQIGGERRGAVVTLEQVWQIANDEGFDPLVQRGCAGSFAAKPENLTVI